MVVSTVSKCWEDLYSLINSDTNVICNPFQDCAHFEEVIRAYHRILDLKGGKHVDTEVLKILVNAIQNNLKDSYGRPCLSFKKATKELFGRLTAENIGNAKLWEMYSDLVSSVENKDNSNEDDLYKAASYMQKATSSFMQSNKDWYKTGSDVLIGLLLSIKYAKSKSNSSFDNVHDVPILKLMWLNVSSIVYIFIFLIRLHWSVHYCGQQKPKRSTNVFCQNDH